MKLKVNRKLTIQQLLNKLPFENKYLDEKIVASLTNEGPEEVELKLFKPGKYRTNQKVLKEYQERKLTLDAGALITLMIKQPEILEEKKYIGVQLADAVFLSFYHWIDERNVYCRRNDVDWDGYWWFGGVASLDSGLLDSPVLEFLDSLELGIKNLREKIK